MRPGAAFRLLFAPAAWAGQFLLLYGAESLFCLHGPGPRAYLLFACAVSAAVLFSISAHGFKMAQAARRTRDFASVCGALLALLSAVAALWTALPALLLPACATPF